MQAYLAAFVGPSGATIDHSSDLQGNRSGIEESIDYDQGLLKEARPTPKVSMAGTESQAEKQDTQRSEAGQLG